MKTPAQRLLEAKKYTYWVHTYPVDDGLLDGLSVSNKLAISPSLLYKTLVLEAKSKKIYVFLVPSNRELDLKKAAKLTGEKKIDLLNLAKLKELTGYEKGGCSPLAMKKSFPTYIDEGAREEKTIYVSGGRLGLSLELEPVILEKLLKLDYVKL